MKKELEKIVDVKKGAYCPNVECPGSAYPNEMIPYCPACPYLSDNEDFVRIQIYGLRTAA